MRTNTDNITIGRNVSLTYHVLEGIRYREQRRIARRRRMEPITSAIRRVVRLLSRRS